MTAPMGGKFTDAYPTRARVNDQVDALKIGTYALVLIWTGALSE